MHNNGKVPPKSSFVVEIKFQIHFAFTIRLYQNTFSRKSCGWLIKSTSDSLKIEVSVFWYEILDTAAWNSVEKVLCIETVLSIQLYNYTIEEDAWEPLKIELS